MERATVVIFVLKHDENSAKEFYQLQLSLNLISHLCKSDGSFSAIMRVWVDGDGSSKKAPRRRGFCKQVTTNDQSESSSSLGGTNFSIVAAFCFTSLLR